MEQMYNRNIAIKALVGSHNYNLNTIMSDKDYKYFVYPTFEDLYHGKMFATAVQTETVDYDVHDIRKLSDLLWKENLNFIEVLFSVDLVYDPRLRPIFVNRDNYAVMNLPYFCKATYGMHLMKMRDLHKGTAKTQVLVDRFGYDTKQACHALRCLYVLGRLADGMSMGEALWFGDDTWEHFNLLEIKAGKWAEEQFHEIVNLWNDTRKAEVMAWFEEQEAHEFLHDELELFVRELIRKELIEGEIKPRINF
jgi:predicted nucleotidyltransferase